MTEIEGWEWWAWGQKRFSEGWEMWEKRGTEREIWRVRMRSRGKQGPPGFRLAE